MNLAGHGTLSGVGDRDWQFVVHDGFQTTFGTMKSRANFSNRSTGALRSRLSVT
jgi:hypothetical protein